MGLSRQRADPHHKFPFTLKFLLVDVEFCKTDTKNITVNLQVQYNDRMKHQNTDIITK